MGKRQLPNAKEGSRVPATAVWIPLTQTPSRPFRAWTVKERRNPTSLPFDSREIERSDLSKAAQRGIPETSAPDSSAGQPTSAPTLALSAPQYRPPPWGNPVRAALGANRGHWEKRGPPRVPAPTRAPAALWAAGGAPPPGPLVNAVPRHQPPRLAAERSSDPEPHFLQRAGSGCAEARPRACARERPCPPRPAAQV